MVSISGGTEVTEGATTIPFLVSLSEPLETPCSVSYTTGISSAMLNVDYRLSTGGAVGTINFTPGETFKVIAVQILDDKLPERMEQVSISLRNARNCTLGTSQATVAIDDDDWYSVAITGAEGGVTKGSQASLTLQLSKPAATAKSFRVTASGETARPGRDFVTFIDKLVTVKAGATSASFAVPTLGGLAEDDRTFSVRVTPTSGDVQVPSPYQVTINGNQPALSVSDVSAWEGNGVGGIEYFLVSLSTAAPNRVSVDYQTIDRSASQANNDYTPVKGTLIFEPGETQKTVPVSLVGDYSVEPNEDFLLFLSNPINASLRRPIGVATILTDDITPSMSVSDVSVVEGNSGSTLATFVISLSANTSLPVTVSYATTDGTATVADRDYVAASGILTFAPGETQKTVSVQVLGDTRPETDETFSLVVSSVTNAAISKDSGVATIQNDDGGEVPGFQITMIYDPSVPSGLRSLFDAAAARWSRVIVGDLPGVMWNGILVDDLLIRADVKTLAKPNTIAQAGFVDIRVGNSSKPANGNGSQNGLPYIGQMTINSSYVNAVGIGNTIAHEMGHVLGFGTLWASNTGSFASLVEGIGTSNPVFKGANATREYNSRFGVAGTSVPLYDSKFNGTQIESFQYDGSYGAHWRDDKFNKYPPASQPYFELMTAKYAVDLALPNGQPIPSYLSRITVGAMEDLGYTVNLDNADPYTAPGRLSTAVQQAAAVASATRSERNSVPLRGFAWSVAGLPRSASAALTFESLAMPTAVSQPVNGRTTRTALAGTAAIRLPVAVAEAVGATVRLTQAAWITFGS